jgi:hypothetical protein
MRVPQNAAADDCFARPGIAELTIELATLRSSRSGLRRVAAQFPVRPEARVADHGAGRSLSSSGGHAADERVGDRAAVRDERAPAPEFVA